MDEYKMRREKPEFLEDSFIPGGLL